MPLTPSEFFSSPANTHSFQQFHPLLSHLCVLWPNEKANFMSMEVWVTHSPVVTSLLQMSSATNNSSCQVPEPPWLNANRLSLVPTLCRLFQLPQWQQPYPEDSISYLVFLSPDLVLLPPLLWYSLYLGGDKDVLFRPDHSTVIYFSYLE